MGNALIPVLGGPMGRHARPAGVWFNPLPWALVAATALFALLYLRHLPCLQRDATQAVDAFVRLCYTDIQTSFVSQGLAAGESVFGEQTAFAPLTAVAVAATVWLTSLRGPGAGGASDLQAHLDALPLFFGLTTLLLFAAFLVATVAAVLMGPDSAGGRYRSWWGLAVAASPIVLAVGLIDWSLLPVGLAMLGLLWFAQRRVLEAAIVLGLAASAGTMAIAVWLGVAVAVGLRGRRGTVVTFFAASIGTFLAVHLPLLINRPGTILAHYLAEIDRPSSDGSLLYLLEQMFGFQSREIGGLFFAVRLLLGGVLIAWLFVTRRRPRVGTLVGIFVLGSVLIAPGFSPQTALWVLLAVYVARPFAAELWASAAFHAVYAAAIWGWLSGHLTAARNGPVALYYLAVLARVAVEVWILVECLLDAARPARDPLRTPDLSDPLGGVLVDDERLAPLGGPPVLPARADRPVPIAQSGHDGVTSSRGC
ncbi:MAG TPA: hypothetical protein PKE40_06520 [Arachnia sp.]|nr:hypothetical protein [Arachnia sp.]HMT85991.1 hypothetical protein [Arachnia sp.]